MSKWIQLINKFNIPFEEINETSDFDFELVLPYSSKVWDFFNTLRLNDINIDDKIKLQEYITLKIDDIELFEDIMNTKRMYDTRNYGNRTLDLKVGYSCNNNCIHCVVKPNIFDLRKKGSNIKIDPVKGIVCDDPDTNDLVKLINHELSSGNYCEIVWTGGEPLMREDIVEIMTFVKRHYPSIKFTVQTNGRALDDINLVRNLWYINRDTFFVVAVHGKEDVHNKVVNNRQEKGDPYYETLRGITNLKSVFGESLTLRSEIVLSKFNIDTCYESVEEQYMRYGINYIGISYPHLEGYPEKFIDNVCPTYDKVREQMIKINELVLKSQGNLEVVFEEVPPCIYHGIENFKIGTMEYDKQVKIFYMLDSTENDFHSYLYDVHYKNKKCRTCKYNSECMGVWVESFAKNRKYLTPVV